MVYLQEGYSRKTNSYYWGGIYWHKMQDVHPSKMPRLMSVISIKSVVPRIYK